MKCILHSLLAVTAASIMMSCMNNTSPEAVRQPVDTVGFAQYDWQVDSLLARIERYQPDQLREAEAPLADISSLRVAVSPHDDYSYVGYLYPALLRHVKSDIVILFGVGHRAKDFNLEDKIIFGSFDAWKTPGGTVEVSELQSSILDVLPDDLYAIHDSLQAVEHSLEALVPFLEYYNPDVKIIPIIVPYMSFGRMETIAAAIAPAIMATMDKAGLQWGEGWSIVISTDAVHYGNEDWGGKNYDRYGVDSAGYKQALLFEEHIMSDMLTGDLNPEKIKSFSSCLVQENNYREYQWTWCGRYAVPLGLLTAYNISVSKDEPLSGIAVGYSNSIANEPVPVDDIGMGFTAPAKLTHWVGYAAVGYK